ncbi:hypothetical protein LY78DRAFT_677225 [Colletotrichum sublineola]|uniref:Uncharacterized protein n=1 Tax=Colletotrichum sublineola TaxID=1173701 RepID=A0A066XPP1_COLSU|nr:hypothetical protein LY78DRAFT_677225 [Colletotrichum sublineola]KDN67691.1 hypothetical protein CSUB01_01219 [Colletotrichum sublineola]
MTRRLPWDRNTPERLPTPKKPKSATTPRKPAVPQRTTPQQSRINASLGNLSRNTVRSDGFLEDRSPSTSPPPEPLPETFMIEGLEHDDKYRMVEDELFTVAGQFTAHLHAAEYQRLKAQARSQNAEAIRNISRPVVGSLTELARKRQEELLRKKKQREALRQAKQEAGRGGKESGDETSIPWQGTSLQGLMHSPRKREVPLMALTKGNSGMKASSLFGGLVRSQSKRPMTTMKPNQDDEETDDESDDLGGSSPLTAKREDPGGQPSTHSRPVPQKPKIPDASIRMAETKSAIRKGGPPTSMSTRLASTKTTATLEDDGKEDEDDDDIFTRFKKRRATSRPQRREAEKKEEKPEPRENRDIIPSFI